jgi:hypothetical protein
VARQSDEAGPGGDLTSVGPRGRTYQKMCEPFAEIIHSEGAARIGREDLRFELDRVEVTVQTLVDADPFVF